MSMKIYFIYIYLQFFFYLSKIVFLQISEIGLLFTKSFFNRIRYVKNAINF